MRNYVLVATIAALLQQPGLAKPATASPSRADIKACPAFARVDFKQIAMVAPPKPGWRERMDEHHRKTRGEVGVFSPPADAKLLLRIWAPASHTQGERVDTSSLVWLGVDDIWRVHRVDHKVGGPPPIPKPPPPDWDKSVQWTGFAPGEYEALRREVKAGVLMPSQVAIIEAALKNPCFNIQPDSLPLNVPVKKGQPEFPPCWGVIGGTLEMRWSDGRHRDVTELCGGFYATGIISAVMYARPQPVADTIQPQ